MRKTRRSQSNPRSRASYATRGSTIETLANAVEAVQDGRIYIELNSAPLLFEHKASPAENKAGLDLTVKRGWLRLHESGTYVKFTQAGAELFA